MKRAIFAGLIVATSAGANAIVVVDTFVPVDTYNLSTVWGFYNPFQTSAMQFVSNVNAPLASITMAMKSFGGPQSIQITLYSDNANTVGTALETWNVTVNSQALYTVTSSGTPLTNGTAYWIGGANLTTNGSAGWNRALTGGQRLAQFGNNSGSWNPAFLQEESAFRVQAVPEPTSILALGLGAIGLFRRRRQKWLAIPA